MRWIYALIILFVLSCKNDKSESPEPVIETVYPLPYFPLYPGSWWTYVNENGDSIETITISDYQQHSYADITQNGAQTSVVKIPFWDQYPMYGYSYPKKVRPDDNGLTLVAFLTTQKGDQWIIIDNNGDVASRETITIDTSITVCGVQYDNVICVYDYWESISDSIPKMFLSSWFYAENVGLIMQHSYNGGEMRLSAFHVNH
jgi:hypothetical protein